MDISFIIVSYNTCGLLRDCLKSVFGKTEDVSYEVIVVDNDSKDNSCEMVENEFPEARLVRSKVNLGFGKANNLGLSHAQGKYVLFLNSDCVLINNASKVLYDVMEGYADCAACGGNLFNSGYETVHAYGYFNSPKRYFLKVSGLRYFIDNPRNDDDRESTHEVEQLIGADLMVRKSVLDEVGVFDERFFLYCEESELQFRIRKAGYKIMYTPDAKIFHFEGASTKQNKAFRRHTIIKSEYLFFRLCYPNVPRLFLRLLCTLPNLYRCLKSPGYTVKALKYVWTT